jgi:Heterokaryon incompatibility protein (HET)
LILSGQHCHQPRKNFGITRQCHEIWKKQSRLEAAKRKAVQFQMFDISHYHSLDEVLESAPPRSATCQRCRTLKFLELFSGPRYEDFDQGYEKPEYDVPIATLAEIRKSAYQCRICYIIVAFHDAKHPAKADCTEGASEDLEYCILKPYRTDALLQMNDQSNGSNKESIATSLALFFKVAPRRQPDGVYPASDLPKNTLVKDWLSKARDALLWSAQLFQQDLIAKSKIDQVGVNTTVENLAPDSVVDSADSDNASEGGEIFSSGSSVHEESRTPVELDRALYSAHHCFFSLTAGFPVETRPTLSLSRSAHGSTVDWSSLRAWLKACEIDHPDCRQDHRNLPVEDGGRMRCIDVRTSQIVSLDFESRYLALSYVWGAPQSEIAGQVVRSIITDDSTVIVQNLPPTVRDAITVTKRLRERYLWVDCVCIDQTDQAAIHEQVGIMDRIYENALLTIITSTSDNAHCEIPGLRRNSRLKSCVETLIDGREMKGVCAGPIAGEFFGQWGRRGWTFQEWLLSRRCLVFSGNQILFRCQESSGLESFVPPKSAPSKGKNSISQFWPDPRSSGTIVSKPPLGSPMWSFQTYAGLVARYTERDLTYDSDALHAFTGIMRKLQSSCGMSFVEGLPETDILRSLLWSTMDVLEKGTKYHRRPDLPSWAWSAFRCGSGYRCWEVNGSAERGTASVQRFETVIASGVAKPSKARSKGLESNNTSNKPILVSIGFDPFMIRCPDLYKAIRYRHADVVLPPQTEEFGTTNMMISSEIRKLLIHQNPPRTTTSPIGSIPGSRDDVLHPITKECLAGRNFCRDTEWTFHHGKLFFVIVGMGEKESFSSHDAALLYEWDVVGKDGKWHHLVVAMIIDRLSDGTAERASLTSICGADWYTLPLVSEREDLILV